MKYILLIMTILQIKSFWNSFAGIFKTSKYSNFEINDIMAKVDEQTKSKDITDAVMTIVGIIMAIFLTIYYMLISVHVGSLAFATLSCIMIIKSWKNVGKISKWLSDDRDDKIIERKFRDRIWSIVYLSYVGYFVYFLVINW